MEISSFTDFVKETEDFDILAISSLVLFRGQPIQGNLLPSIARTAPNKLINQVEKDLLKQLRLMGTNFMHGNDHTDLELLALAQHFGMKTRLLDWTSNPLTALWFACTDKSEGDVFVYALEADSLFDEDINTINIFEQKKTVVFRPKLNNPRIIAQHGWFTSHKFSNKSGKYVPLEKNPTIEKLVTEYKIPAKHRKHIIQSLDKYGINSRTLFPDLEGLCEYLNWKYKIA